MYLPSVSTLLAIQGFRVQVQVAAVGVHDCRLSMLLVAAYDRSAVCADRSIDSLLYIYIYEDMYMYEVLYIYEDMYIYEDIYMCTKMYIYIDEDIYIYIHTKDIGLLYMPASIL